jgi:thiamine biosynthesis protein ThiI
LFERAALVRYHEIGLKGRNRAQFERRFRENLGAALVGFPVSKIERIASRVSVRISEPEAALVVAERIALIPGVQSVSPSFRVPRSSEDIEAAALLAIREAGAFSTFRVQSRRSNTDYPVPSMETNRTVGAFLQRETGAAVNLAAPDVTVRVDVVQGSAYVSSREITGAGGLPVGMSGRMVALLSAGIDSPVAAWRMIRRGGLVVAVHFSGRPQTNDASERLVLQLGEQLALTGGLARIYVVAFGDLQREISLLCPPDLRILLYRRLMLVVAERIAYQERARALITGESLGQVASQTLDNIAAVDQVATFPVLRPLIGSDKLEIIADARRIGTYELSTTPHTDCCTLFMPRTPETHVRVADLREAWDALPHERMAEDALASLTWTDFGGRGYRPPKAWRTTLTGSAAGSSSDDSVRSAT